MEDTAQKPHRSRQAGRKAEKKNKKKGGKGSEKGNPRAFAPYSGHRASRTAQRNLDREEKKLHVPAIDKTPAEPPPVIVAVAGPPGVGKSTLIKSLVKRFTKHTVNDIKGPVTVVSGKKRRLTFIECNNDLSAMIDIAKIADLVLLMIDASFGFEMETFEFLNVLQSHGFPRIMGVLTHLDKFRLNKTLRTVKKRLKQRFWTEIYQGAKLFYLSGLVNGRYLDQEILNLSRFISVMKFRPLVWRNTHAYVLADRMEDITDPEIVRTNPKTDRTVALFGYMRGTHMREGSKVHIPGVGDTVVSSLQPLPDPCSFPDAARKTLSDKQKLLYAPMSDVGGLIYDRDAVYVNVTNHFNKDDVDGKPQAKTVGEKMVINLQDAPETLADRLEKSYIRIFGHSEPLPANHLNQDNENASDSENEDDDSKRDLSDDEGASSNSGSGTDIEDDSDTLQSGDESESDFESEEEQYPDDSEDLEDGNHDGDSDSDEEYDSNDDDIDYHTLRKKFITGALGGEEEVTRENDGADDEEDGFEDLENPKEGFSKPEESEEQEPEKDRDDLRKKKEQLKRKFDAQYDGTDDEEEGTNFYEQAKEAMAQQTELNRAEFAEDDPALRFMVEGVGPGTYVRMIIKETPCEFVDNFDPCYPVIVGGILVGEEGFGFLQARIKRHRWFNRVLKSNDPLIFSIGWRRFQSLPVYSLNTDATRNRYLKYTPEHMHCLATFYGPVSVPNTGFCAFQSVSDHTSSFRISATGVILDIDQTSEIMKKLKLTGTPTQIFKNTAFIQGMFTSSLEVAKFEGASIRTVSGIRGQVKKAAAKPEGCFRATFEDKILKSDIVFLRAWYPVKPKKFYNPVTTLLLSSKTDWQGMRTVGKLRRDLGEDVPQNQDSQYKPIVRSERFFNPLKIPQSLESTLPFASKPKQLKKKKQQRSSQNTAVILEPSDRKIAALMQQVNTLRKEKEKKRKRKASDNREQYLKRKEREAAMDSVMEKKRRREVYRRDKRQKTEE